MSKNAFRGLLPTLTVLAIVIASVSGLVVQGFPASDVEVAGSILSTAWATVPSTLEKDVEDCVLCKATIKNTGNLETTYCIVAKWSEHGLDEWETVGLADVCLGPGQSETVSIGSIECVEWMMGKYFDVKFILYECDADPVLDDDVIAEAFYVNEVLVDGSFTGCWVE
jgi:hypothetical protein